ncbi:MAG: ComEC/Rec2 family competence protein [Verrucomicrobiae bacterium]|nr:ComEC/Rec2 family competence protein [Verrucomicrobiae bacterium]
MGPAIAFAVGCSPWLQELPVELWLSLGSIFFGLWLRLKQGRARQWVFYGLMLCLALAYRWWDRWEPREYALRNLGDWKLREAVFWRLRVDSDLRMSKKAYEKRRVTERATYFGFAEVLEWRRDENEGKGKAVGRVFLRLRGVPHGALAYGDELWVRGRLKEPEVVTAPGRLNWKSYLEVYRADYILEADVSDAEIIGRGSGKWWVALAYGIRAWAFDQLVWGLEGEEGVTAILAGMLFGYTMGISESVEELFRITGTYHIFAVSGQNVGILLMVGLILLRSVGLRVWRVGWVFLPVLVLYAFVSDLQPSVVRAVTMVAVVLWAWRIYRPLSWLNFWAAALWLLLLFEPRYLGAPGFVLSFSVVLGLIVVSPPVFNLLMKPFKPLDAEALKVWGRWRLWGYGVVKFFAGLVAMGIGAWCGSVVWMVVYFQRVSLVSVVANMAVVPLAGVIVVVGVLSLCFAPWVGWVTVSLNNFNWLVVKAMVAVVTVLGQWSWAVVYLPHPSAWGGVSVPTLTLVGGGKTVTGLLRYGRCNWLIDPGRARDVQYRLRPLLHYYGAWDMEQVYFTQMSVRATGATEFVLRRARVREWVLPPRLSRSRGYKEWLKLLSKGAVRQRVVSRGERLELGAGLVCEVLWPPEDFRSVYLEDQGLVLLLRYGESEVLWAGRIGEGIEEVLMRENPGLRVDVLIQGYHPKYPSLGVKWLEHLQPRHFVYVESDVFYPREAPRYDSDRLRGMEQWNMGYEALYVRMGEGGALVSWWRDRDKTAVLLDEVGGFEEE